jgi:protein involved in polysaccharide export with SLBB domain
MNRMVLAAGLSLLASSCTSPGGGLPLLTPEQADRARVPGAGRAYRLSAGDKVSLIVYGEGDLSRTYEVGPDGNIEVPFIGLTRAAGLTVDELSSMVRMQLGNGYLRNPAVAGGIVAYRPFYILGEVNRPGEYSYRTGLTLDGAVALAGGYTYRAHRRFVFIQGEGEDGERRVELAPRLVVRPGDTIRIAERFF